MKVKIAALILFATISGAFVYSQGTTITEPVEPTKPSPVFDPLLSLVVGAGIPQYYNREPVKGTIVLGGEALSAAFGAFLLPTLSISDSQKDTYNSIAGISFFSFAVYGIVDCFITKGKYDKEMSNYNLDMDVYNKKLADYRDAKEKEAADARAAQARAEADALNAKLKADSEARAAQDKADAEARAAQAAQDMAEKAARIAKSSFTDKEKKAIMEEKIFIGMTEAAAIESWGKPEEIHTTTSASGTSKQLIYGSSYVYTTDGVVTTIQQ